MQVYMNVRKVKNMSYKEKGKRWEICMQNNMEKRGVDLTQAESNLLFVVV